MKPNGWLIAFVVILLFSSDAKPTPDVDPTPGGPVRVLIVSETSTRGLRSIVLNDPKIRELQNLRIIDPNSPVDKLPAVWQEAMQLPRTTDQWIVVSNGRRGASQPLPNTVEEILQLVGKYK